MILDQSCDGNDLRALIGAAKARRCSVLLVGEPERCPMLIQGLVDVATQVIAFMAEAGQIQPPLPDAERFVDLSYLARAGVR